MFLSEKKLGKHIFYFFSHSQLSPNPTTSPIASPYAIHTIQYYIFHKTTSHNTTYFHAPHHTHHITTLFYEPTTFSAPHEDVINVENPTKPDAQIVLMTHPLTPSTHVMNFNHNYQLKIMWFFSSWTMLVKIIWS